MLHRMPPLSFPSFGEDSCSGGKSSSATSCDASPSALLYKISEPACRLWFLLTGRSTRATSFLFSLPLCNARPNLISGAYCRARRRPSANRSATFRRRRLLDNIGLDAGDSPDQRCNCIAALTRSRLTDPMLSTKTSRIFGQRKNLDRRNRHGAIMAPVTRTHTEDGRLGKKKKAPFIEPCLSAMFSME